MLAIDLVKTILGCSALSMIILAISALFIDKDLMPVNSMLIIALIALTIMFNI